MDRIDIRDGMSEGPRRGQGGEGDHRPEGSFPLAEWEKSMPWKASWKRRHLSLALKNREALTSRDGTIQGERCSRGGGKYRRKDGRRVLLSVPPKYQAPLSQGLCTCCSLCPECFLSTPPHFLQALAHLH